jgi:hypothetical protein
MAQHRLLIQFFIANQNNLSLQDEAIGDGVRDLYSAGDGKTILKAGYIWKKNNTGFRNWKFRWMVLTPFQLK